MTRRVYRQSAFGVALALLLCGLPVGLHAEGPSCKQLEAERDKLVAIGVDKDMARGYEWARANLPQAELDLIREFIEISERLRFRCQTSATPAEKPDGEKVSAEQTTTSAAIPPLPVKRSSVIGN